MIFDTHCHLNNEQLLERLDEVIESANKVGVNKFLVVGWNKESSLTAIKLAEQYDCIYAAIGFHPTDVFDVTEEDFDEVFKHINHPKVVAVGEIGLDYYWIKEEDKREIQKEFFIKQIEIANKHKKPISIHNRNAFEDCLNILKEHIEDDKDNNRRFIVIGDGSTRPTGKDKTSIVMFLDDHQGALMDIVQVFVKYHVNSHTFIYRI